MGSLLDSLNTKFLGRPRRLLLAPSVGALVVLCAGVAVSIEGIVVTSAGNDQDHYHYPSSLEVFQSFPDVEWSALPTAAGPVYYLIIATAMLVFGPSLFAGQVANCLVAAAFAFVVLWKLRILNPHYQIMVAAFLLFSPYFWQSSLWMLTDNLGALFAFLALGSAVARKSSRWPLVVGLFVALAIGTRQNYVWLLLPAVLLAANVGDGRLQVPSIRDVAWICLPGLTLLATLIAIWGGLTPPSVRDFNDAGMSPVAVSFVFAVMAVFSVPLLISLSARVQRRHAVWAAVVGVAIAVPAVVFQSSATQPPDQSRRGGMVWSLVDLTGELHDRSVLLIVLALVGGASMYVISISLSLQYRVLLWATAFGISAVLTAGSQLYQKYVELPAAIVFLLVATELIRRNKVKHVTALWVPGACGALATVMLVVRPVVSSIQI